LIDAKARFIAESSTEEGILKRLAILQTELALAEARRATVRNTLLESLRAAASITSPGLAVAIPKDSGAEALREEIEILERALKDLRSTGDATADSLNAIRDAMAPTGDQGKAARIAAIEAGLLREAAALKESTLGIRARNDALRDAALLEQNIFGLRRRPERKEPVNELAEEVRGQIAEPLPEVPLNLDDAEDEIRGFEALALDAADGVAHAFGDTIHGAILGIGEPLKLLGQAFKSFFADLAAQIVATSAKFLVLRFVLAPLGIGGGVAGLFGGGGGGGGGGILGGLPGLKDGGMILAPGRMIRAADGVLVTGGVSGLDSVPALLAPGERVVPAYDSPQNFRTRPPVQVTIHAGLLAGDEGTAIELARIVQQKLDRSSAGGGL